MSRTRKGSKGPGWEPWSNLQERQEQAVRELVVEVERLKNGGSL